MFTKLLEEGWRRSSKAEKQKNKSDIQQIDYRELNISLFQKPFIIIKLKTGTKDVCSQ